MIIVENKSYELPDITYFDNKIEIIYETPA